ncbi:MAG: NADP-dependent oxidoreductase, partial [Acidobacteriota bacterium]
ILGYDVAGIVDSLGDGVSRFAVGDRVFGRATRSYAELVIAAADDCFFLPESLSFVQARTFGIA